MTATRERRLGAIRLSGGNDEAVSQAEREAALLDAVREHGVEVLAFSEDAKVLRRRAAYAGIDLSDAAMLKRLDGWLPPLLTGQRRLPQVPASALLGLLDWNERQRLDRVAPPEFVSPAATRHVVDYGAEGGPTVELRVQALYGLDVHPRVGDVPLVLSLTSPAGRPIQTTRDLPAFWRGSWAGVAKEMRGRYPRHNWPERPWEATASLRTKAALARG